MEINDFIQAYRDAIGNIDKKKMMKIIRDSYGILENQKPGYLNLIICMEELGELNIECLNYIDYLENTDESKLIDRDREIPEHLLEELADVQICTDYILDICDLPKEKYTNETYMKESYFRHPHGLYEEDVDKENELLKKTLLKTIKDNSHLQQHLSKYLRGKENKEDLYKALFMVQCRIYSVMEQCYIDKDMMNKAMQVKLDRQDKRNQEINIDKENNMELE